MLPTKENPAKYVLASRTSSGQLQLVLVWHEVMPPASASGRRVTMRSGTFVLRWHAQLVLGEAQDCPQVTGAEVTGLTENEAIARALLTGHALMHDGRMSDERVKEVEAARNEVSFADVAFGVGDVFSAGKAISKAVRYMDGDVCCQHCGDDEREHGDYSICRRCFWKLSEADKQEEGGFGEQA